ncbi:MAG TPA: hypothetical protein VN577_11595 [Terriglobales bacterium]|nr:hypothetical protein [Terriglobales bacterium]
MKTRFVAATVEQRFMAAAPQLMIGDRAYDSDLLDQQLRQQHGIELIAPHKVNRSKPKPVSSRQVCEGRLYTEKLDSCCYARRACMGRP